LLSSGRSSGQGRQPIRGQRPKTQDPGGTAGFAPKCCFGAPLGLACVPQLHARCTSQVLVCLRRAPPTGGMHTHSASQTRGAALSPASISSTWATPPPTNDCTAATTRQKRGWMPPAGSGTRARAPLPSLRALRVLLLPGGGIACVTKNSLFR
jgi:hypothetical protein